MYCFALSTAEITLLDNNIIIYKFVQDLHFFVTGGDDANEIILASVLQGFFDAITLLLRYFRSNFAIWILNLDALFFIMLLLSCIFFFCAIYRNNVGKREALENLDLILLCLDEIVDGGYASVISYSLLFALRKSFDLFSKYFLP